MSALEVLDEIAQTFSIIFFRHNIFTAHNTTLETIELAPNCSRVADKPDACMRYARKLAIEIQHELATGVPFCQAADTVLFVNVSCHVSREFHEQALQWLCHVWKYREELYRWLYGNPVSNAT